MESSVRSLNQDRLGQVIENDDDVPTISPDMLHHDRIDFEQGLKLFPPATFLLMLACIAVYSRQVWIGGLVNVARVVATGAVHREHVLRGEVWRLVSGAFMHANAEHLIGNMIMLYILGIACEHAFGPGPFLLVYVAVCIAGSLAAMVTDWPTVGASGAIFGLAGAAVALIFTHRSRIEIRDRRIGIVLAVWAIYTLGLGAFNPIVSNACHLGGLVLGLVLGVILPLAILKDQEVAAQRVMAPVSAGLAAAVLLGAAVFFLPHLSQ